jgi:hypothetical protein
MTAEELALALKKENLSETAKLTEEYSKQLDINTRDKQVQEAKLANRYLTNAKTGEVQFLDEKGNIIQGANRDQTKDFASQAKEVQTLADESVKIESEKMEKISKIVKEYEDERARLRDNYFEKDKSLKIAQENMSETFFKNEILRMQQMKSEAIATANALIAMRNA